MFWLKLQIFVELKRVWYAIGCNVFGHFPLITISGRQIYFLHFEDDITLIDTIKQLQYLTNRLTDCLKVFGTQTSTDMYKFMGLLCHSSVREQM